MLYRVPKRGAAVGVWMVDIEIPTQKERIDALDRTTPVDTFHSQKKRNVSVLIHAIDTDS